MSNRNNSIQDALNLVIQHSQAGRQDKAENIFEQLLKVLPSDADDLHSLGGVAYQLGKYEIAIDLLNKAIQNDSTRDYLYCNLGSLLKSQGRLDEAVASYRNALAINPNYAEAHNNLGIALKAQGKLDEAIASYQRAIAINQDYAEAHSNLGIALNADGKREEAVESFQRAVSINPSFVEGYLNLANALDAHEELDEAVASYRNALAINPNYAEAHNNLGIALKAQGKLDEAIASYQRAIAINPDYAEAHFNLGNALSDKGKSAEAATSYKGAIAINPDYAEAYNNLGIVLKAQDKMDEAVTSYQCAITINPNYTEALHNLGVILKDQGKLDEAATLYERVLALDPTHPSARHMLAALRGETTEMAPAKYVKVLFDRYSSNYDHHLMEKLQYNTPALLRQALQSLFSHDLHFQNAIDLGCGTGLAGTEFREMAARLSGIDISPKMIEEAEKKDIYDVLVVGNIMEFLNNASEKYDLFIAADVFLYIGNLAPLFTSIRTRSSIGAYLVFSTESSHEKEYVLRQTGRYAHSRNYIQSLAKDHRCIVEKCQSGGLRKEKGQWTMGDIFVLKHVT